MEELESKKKCLGRQVNELYVEIARLRAMNAEKSSAIEGHEQLHNRSFTCFPRLPPELRNRIWQFSTPPRMISITVTASFRQGKPACDADANIRVPTISRVCKESRDLFLREHILVGSSKLWRGRVIDKSARTYANTLIDTFYVSNSSMFYADPMAGKLGYAMDLVAFLAYMYKLAKKEVGGTEKWSIRSLALENHALEFFYENPSTLLFFDGFQALEEVVFLCAETSRIGTFRNPTDETTLETWEEGMRILGFLKRLPDFPRYALKLRTSYAEQVRTCYAEKMIQKWENLKDSVAILSKTSHGSQIEDMRQGLHMMGPSNVHEDWSTMTKDSEE